MCGLDRFQSAPEKIVNKVVIPVPGPSHYPWIVAQCSRTPVTHFPTPWYENCALQTLVKIFENICCEKSPFSILSYQHTNLGKHTEPETEALGAGQPGSYSRNSTVVPARLLASFSSLARATGLLFRWPAARRTFLPLEDPVNSTLDCRFDEKFRRD